MRDHQGVTFDRNMWFDHLAANLTRGAYAHLLQHEMKGSWLELELRLWRLVRETVRHWARELPMSGSSDQLKAWGEGLLVDLTEAAFYLALDCGIKGSLLEVELGLECAFRSVINKVGQGSRRTMSTPPRTA